jgi:hypothetical protein
MPVSMSLFHRLRTRFRNRTIAPGDEYVDEYRCVEYEYERPGVYS